MRTCPWTKTSLVVACVLLIALALAGQRTSAAQPAWPSDVFRPMAEPPLYFSTRTLQQGSGGYAGAEDTFINEWDPEATHGADWHLSVRPRGVQVALLRFDVSELPAAADIAVATLRVHAIRRSNENPTRLTCWMVNRSWDASAADWTHATADEEWEEPGCAGIPGDRSAAASQPAELGEPGTSCTLDVTEMVREWVTNPESNHGLLLGSVGGVGVRYQLGSSGYPRGELRPALTVIYAVRPSPTPTFTPTATPMPTHTPTPTFTPTATPTLPPVLEIEKHDSTDPVCTTDMLRYNISIANTGDVDATNVVVTDQIPLGAYFIEASPGGIYNRELEAVVWEVGALRAGARKGVYVEVGLYEWIAQEGVITNAARVEADDVPSASAHEWTTILLPTPPPLRYYYWPLMFQYGAHSQ